MKAFNEYLNKTSRFWGLVSFVSENLGYSEKDKIKSYSFEEIFELFKEKGIRITNEEIRDVENYLLNRASILNNYVKGDLMDVEEARYHYDIYYSIYKKEKLKCKLPLNKQKGDMRNVAYFTALINIITERILNEFFLRNRGGSIISFDDDPRSLSYFYDQYENIIGSSSRRFDGAFPNTINPKIVWEIKEYYYNKTFGSRVADGVYETQLDGYEFKDLFNGYHKKVYHVLFVDSYNTWWTLGKPYLCRLIDTLNKGLVDEVIFGKEIFTDWPNLMRNVLIENF